MHVLRIQLPYHLRVLAQVGQEVTVSVTEPVTLGSALAALEDHYPRLRGTIRDYGSLRRRPMVRFFACQEDLSNCPSEHLLPAEVLSGREPLIILGAIAGG